MGTTLTNGVYLPNEGERNCYAGLKTNWEILDQKVADVTALQQAVAGALHREIVESLPTTDIDPNTIYMVLSGTSATENVYNEFMYVNNAWELIGTSATDLTNYYTKADVDGKLLLKANASDLTSHTGDTTIHVTASDKAKWNNQTYVLRYSSTTLVASSTNSNALLDNTDNLKVGDKVIDNTGNIYVVTAIDTANSTFTIGTSLIDLAQDSDVVHKSGDESVGGIKTFSSDLYVANTDTTANTPNLSLRNYKADRGTTDTAVQTISFTDKNSKALSLIESRRLSNGTTATNILCYNTDDSNNTVSGGVTILKNKTDTIFAPATDNAVTCGRPLAKWSGVYSTEYYYGANNTPFTDKFVTTDTAQTVSGNKTFSDNLTIYNSDDAQTPKGLVIRNAQWGMGESGGVTTSNINFLDKNSGIPASIIASKGISGQSFLRFNIRTKNSQNTTYSEEIYYDIDTSGNVEFRSWHDNITTLGTSLYKWKDVNTYLVNGLEPSSLGMPSNSYVDISSYFTNTGDGQTNSYTPTVNGYVYINAICAKLIMQIRDRNDNIIYADIRARPNDGTIYMTIPVCANNKVLTQWFTSSAVTVTTARFIPCQGNV